MCFFKWMVNITVVIVAIHVQELQTLYCLDKKAGLSCMHEPTGDKHTFHGAPKFIPTYVSLQ